MNILKLSAYYYPEQISSAHLTYDIEEALIKAGHKIIIIAPSPSRNISNDLRRKYKKLKIETKYDGAITIRRFRMFKEGKNPLIRAVRYFLCNVIQYIKGCREKDIDLVFAGSTPPTQGFLCGRVAAKLSRKSGKKVPFIYNLQDIFPDSLVNAKMIREKSIIWKIGRKIEDCTYRYADKIIVISDDFKRNIIAKGVPEGKIAVIPNWVNVDNVYPIDRDNNVLIKRFNLNPDKFYITYCGNIGLSQNMDLLISVAKELKIAFPNIYFILIGEGADKERLVNIIKQDKIDNILIFPFQPYEDIAHVFSLGDIGLVISKPGIGGSSVPSKMWSIMAAGRPVLASFDKNSALVNLIEDNNIGIAVDADDRKNFIDGIKALYLMEDDDLKNIGYRAQNYVNTYLNKNICIEKYINLINEMIILG